MNQLSLFDLPLNEVNSLCWHWRALGDGLTQKFETKLHPALAHQRLTRRRANIIGSLKAEGRKLQRIQQWLYAMAEAAQARTLPPILSKIRTLTLLNDLYECNNPLSIFDNPNPQQLKRFRSARLTDALKVQAALDALNQLVSVPPSNSLIERIEDLERSLIGRDIPGYFPTPRDLAQRMVKLAQLEEGQAVWEPSAGKGNLAEVIVQSGIAVNLSVSEIDYTLQQILKLKDFVLIGSDCLTLRDRSFDRIIANPPFSHGLDIVHIRHYYECLRSDGRLVTLSSTSYTFRKNKLFREFKKWLEDKCVFEELLPKDTFLKSDRPTSMQTILLVLQKL